MTRYAPARHIAALVVVTVGCPAALFGSVVLGCGAVGYTGRCAMDSLIMSPIILLVAGIIAAILSRGWAGILAVVGGVILGMLLLFFASDAMGRPLPIDPVQAVIASIWFMVPTLFGYGVGRGVMLTIGWAMKPEAAKAVETQPAEAPSA